MTRLRQAFDQHPTAATLAVVVAALALVAVAALLLVNLLGTAEPVADASPSTAAESEAPSIPESVAPSPSDAEPSPSEALQEVAYGDPIAVEATADTPLLVQPAVDETVGTVPAGGIATIVDGPLEADGRDWYIVVFGELTGAIAADDPSLILHRGLAQSQPATAEGLDAGPRGFVAWGIADGLAHEPRLGFTAISTDGIGWQISSTPEGELGELFGTTVAGGPNGWVMLRGTAEGTGLGGAWRSEDGTAWEPIEVMRNDGGSLNELVPLDLLGHASGYALVARDDSTGTSRHALLTSRDGTTWTQLEMAGESNDVQVAHLGDGFMAWSVVGEGQMALGFSPDGQEWVDLASDPAAGPLGYSPIVVEADGVLVAVTTDIPNGSRRWWTSPAPTAATPTLSWTEQPAVAEQLSGTGVIGLVGLDAAALAVGRSFDDGAWQAWRTADGITWVEVDAEPMRAANVSGYLIDGADAGVVAIGYETTDAGPNPMALHSVNGDAWLAADDRIAPLVASSVPGACPDEPTRMVDWMAIPGAIGAECFGDAPMTFTAWNTAAGGCGGYSPGFYEPAWLAPPFAESFVLLPFEAPTGGCGGPVHSPDAGAPPDLQQWITLTGHWADPASETCRYRPDPAATSDAFRPDLVFYCRTVFVATQASPSGLAP